MNPRLQLWLVGALGSALAVVGAWGIAQENYTLAAAAVAVIAWLALEWIGGPRPEAWGLAAVLVGYVLANRGFAQLSFSSQLPLLPAEAALAMGLAATLLRMARRDGAAVRRDALNLAVLAWLIVGAARLWPDLRAHGAMALRDFATIYYALFFFVAQGLAAHAPSARLLRTALVGAVAVLPVTFFLAARFPEFFLGTLQVRGAPLIYYKEDLVAAFFFAGFFLIATTPWPAVVRAGVGLAGYGLAFTIASSRAAIMGLLVTGAWWAVARRWGPWKLQALAAPLALAVIAIVAVARGDDFRQSRLYGLYEHVASMADFSGTGRYTTDERRYVGDNNRFRLAWWRSVAEETRDGGPVFGLGFGYDLADRFVKTYELDLGEDFSARSPHSVVFTVLGRMGMVGLLILVGIVGAMAAATWRLARRVRTDDAALPALGWWSVAWVLLVSGCFGVVLEGPMGAVIFWTALGMAHATSTESPADELERAREPAAALPSAAGSA